MGSDTAQVTSDHDVLKRVTVPMVSAATNVLKFSMRSSNVVFGPKYPSTNTNSDCETEAWPARSTTGTSGTKNFSSSASCEPVITGIS